MQDMLYHMQAVLFIGAAKWKPYTSLMKLCAFGMLMASSAADPVAVLSHGQACVNSAVYQCEVVNSNFDKSLNHIHLLWCLLLARLPMKCTRSKIC